MDVFEVHKKHIGKLKITSSVKVKGREDLSKIYTPGVGRICMAIKDNPSLVRDYTIAGKTVAVISDGSAVLGFGNIGPAAALPVMEGKCVIFKEFAGIDAFPICVSTQNTKEIIELVKNISVNFAAINLEDISAPRCFEIEETLTKELNIPVVHDDQHGTAIVTLAALMGAIKLSNKKNINVVISGAGAAGTAVTKLLLDAKDKIFLNSISVYDSVGLLSSDRSDSNIYKKELVKLTKQKVFKKLEEGLRGADVFIGLSVANLVSVEMVKKMAKDPIVFAMANPTPEIMPADAKKAGAFIVATGRSDFPNQINNALAYPGVFKGLLENKITRVLSARKIKAAEAIYKYNLPNLTRENILPSILDKKVPKIISKAFKEGQ